MRRVFDDDLAVRGVPSARDHPGVAVELDLAHPQGLMPALPVSEDVGQLEAQGGDLVVDEPFGDALERVSGAHPEQTRERRAQAKPGVVGLEAHVLGERLDLLATRLGNGRQHEQRCLSACRAAHGVLCGHGLLLSTPAE